MKKIVKELVPPAFVKLYRNLRYGSGERYGYFGNYKNWDSALAASSGYDSDLILSRVRDALVMVRDGKAPYERDSVVFDRIEYAWPLLSALLWIATHSGNCLDIIDFGGSLGSTYFQNAGFLDGLERVRWSIVEQKKFVDCGKKEFAGDRLRFYHDIGSCLAAEKPNAILLSSVLQYIDRPYPLLRSIFDAKFEFIVVDRTILFDSPDRVTVQVVPPNIYEASYPCWIFNRRKFLDFFASEYSLVAGFEALGGALEIEGAPAMHEGFIFRRKAGTR